MSETALRPHSLIAQRSRVQPREQEERAPIDFLETPPPLNCPIPENSSGESSPGLQPKAVWFGPGA